MEVLKVSIGKLSKKLSALKTNNKKLGSIVQLLSDSYVITKV